MQLGRLLLLSVKGFGREECGMRAAAISYYVLLSIFPLLIFSVGVLGIFLRDAEVQADVVDSVMENIPLNEEEGRNDVRKALREITNERSGAIGLAGLAGLAWSAASMFGAIRRSLNAVFGAERARPFVQQKLLDLALVVAFSPFFLASIAVTAALRAAAAESEGIPVLEDAAHALGWVWTIASFVLPAVLSFIAFFTLYWRIPAKAPMPHEAAAGALVAALLFEIVKFGFGTYLENFGDYDLIFGPLGAVVAFLAWVYLSASVVLFGAELAAAVESPALLNQSAAQGQAVSFRVRLRDFLTGLFWKRDSRREEESAPPPDSRTGD